MILYYYLHCYRNFYIHDNKEFRQFPLFLLQNYTTRLLPSALLEHRIYYACQFSLDLAHSLYSIQLYSQFYPVYEYSSNLHELNGNLINSKITRYRNKFGVLYDFTQYSIPFNNLCKIFITDALSGLEHSHLQIPSCSSIKAMTMMYNSNQPFNSKLAFITKLYYIILVSATPPTNITVLSTNTSIAIRWSNLVTVPNYSTRLIGFCVICNENNEETLLLPIIPKSKIL